MTSNEELRAWAYLSRVAEPPCAELAEFAMRVGAIEAAARISRADNLPVDLGPLVEARRDQDCAHADLELLERRGGRLVTRDDDDWPTLAFRSFRSRAMEARPRSGEPLVLWALGPIALGHITERAAAIVGTRAATSYGEHVAAELAVGLVERDVAVVSGGAFGIDGVAHRATLGQGGVTAAVLAGGIDVLYPAGNSALLHRISTTGLLVTEYPPGVRPARHRFLTRNRLVAALSGATVVVEAGLRSGATNTALWADALGRPVCAVPGPVTSAASAGCHQLLQVEGRHLVGRAAEVVELVGRFGELADPAEHPVTPLDGLTEAQRAVYEALPGRGGSDVEQIALAAGLSPQRVLGPLATLELGGFVKQVDGLWRLASRR